MRYISITVALLSVFLLSCKRNENLQEPGSGFMQGVWEENHVAYQDKLLQYTKHRFKITCDSFYVTMDTYSKANTFTDSCFSNGHFTEYAKGLYAVKKDTIFFSGTFTKSNFKQKISGCYRTGEYLIAFSLKLEGADSLKLVNKMNQLPITLIKKEKSTCIPKPIE
jgi:hypothetical protein